MAFTLTRRIAVAAGTAAIIGMGGLTACSSGTKDKPAETTAPSQSSSQNAPQPTEKAVSPNKSFAPTVKATPAPTEKPGDH